MASSDEDGEILPDFVTNYELVDGRDQMVSFSCIPLCWTGDDLELDGTVEMNARFYLHGTTSDGLERIYKQVLAWKYNISSAQPEVSVLCKGKYWIQLLEPRKRFEVITKSTLVTLHFLHFVKHNPEAPAQCIWNHLARTFSSSDVQPCKQDILDHIGLVKDAFESDIDLPQSEYMCKILGEQPKKRKLFTNSMDEQPAKKPSFVVDETEHIESLNLLQEEEPGEEEKEPEEEEEEEPEEEKEEEEPEEEKEEEEPEEEEEKEVEDRSSLNLSNVKEDLKEAEKLDVPDALQEEENLGDGKDDDAEGKEEHEHNEEEIEDDEELQLFDSCCAICDNGGDILCCEGPCMRSFHPTIASGNSNCRSLGLSQAEVDAMPVFFCKNCKYKKHQCFVCGKLGSSDNDSGAEVFCCVSATCGRFYHPQCVAKALYPENATQARKIEAQVAAGDMFTCPVHKCLVCGHSEDRNIHTLQFAICRRCPKAYHRKCLPRGISFESDSERNVPQRAWDDLLPNRILIYCRDHKIIRSLGTPVRDHIIFSENSMVKNKYVTEKVGTENRLFKIKGQNVAKFSPLERNPSKKLSQIHYTGEVVYALKAKKDVEGVESVRNLGQDIARPGFNYLRKTQFVEGSSKFSASHGMFQNREACHSLISNARRPVIKIKKWEKTAATTKPVILEKDHDEDIDQLEIERSINSLIEEVDSTFSIDHIKSHQRTASFYNGSRDFLEKSITMGKVEATVKAVHTALEKLDNGCSIEDAKNICGPEMIDQLERWKHKLQLYLGPFLHGVRYTSYGRHFTKLEKLQEIVDMLHWYAEDGDTIVDFSCGSNDFSCLMSKKLESVGKKCYFKNYDIFQAKNDFNFEKRDWFSVGHEELPIGSRLIIGLNPPFGVKAKLANRFIDKALQFKPKLMILIVPRETHRLDQKSSPYNLIWEDVHLLAGKSFYLPGSIDVHNKQLEQWNLVSPPLSLWSRPDLIQKHREIAMMCNHLPKETQGIHLEQNVSMENRDFSTLTNQHTDLSGVLNDVPKDGGVYEPQHGNHTLGTVAQFVPYHSTEAQHGIHTLGTQAQFVPFHSSEAQHGIHTLGTQAQFMPFHSTETQHGIHTLGTQAQFVPFHSTEAHHGIHTLGTQAQFVPFHSSEAQHGIHTLGTQDQFVPSHSTGAQPFWPNDGRQP